MELRKTAVSLLIGTLFISVVHAQPKSLGTSYSFGGAGVVYEHTLSHDTFAGLSLKAETAEMFMGRTGHPGISASFTWNLILKEVKVLVNNSVIKLEDGNDYVVVDKIDATDKSYVYKEKGLPGTDEISKVDDSEEAYRIMTQRCFDDFSKKMIKNIGLRL